MKLSGEMLENLIECMEENYKSTENVMEKIANYYGYRAQFDLLLSMIEQEYGDCSAYSIMSLLKERWNNINVKYYYALIEPTRDAIRKAVGNISEYPMEKTTGFIVADVTNDVYSDIYETSQQAEEDLVDDKSTFWGIGSAVIDISSLFAEERERYEKLLLEEKEAEAKKKETIETLKLMGFTNIGS